MKRENTLLLLNTIIMVVVGILLVIVATQVIPNKPEDNLFGQVVTLKNKQNIEPIPNEDFFMVVHSKEEAYNISNQLVGTVYTVVMKNTYGYGGTVNDIDGYLELLVGIDMNDRVSVEIVELVQSNWTISGIQRYIKTILQNVPKHEIENIGAYDAANPDMITGMTATDTTGWIKDIILEILILHESGIPEFPMITGVQTNVSVERDAEFNPLAGITVYDYQDGDLTDQLEAIGYESVDLSVAGVYNYSISVTDSDNNTTTIDVVLTVVGGEIQMFDDAFGNGYVSVKDDSFTTTDTVLEKYDVTLNGNPVGFIYKLTGDGIYNDWVMLSGEITIWVAIDFDAVVLGVDIPREEYHHSKTGSYSSYYTASVNYANEFIGHNLSEVRTIETDLLAGGTAKSKELISDLLFDLKEVVLG